MIWPFNKPKAKDREIARLESRIAVHAFMGRNTNEWFVAVVEQRDEADAAKMELARQLAEACRERDQALRRESDLLAGNEINRKTLIKHNADHAKDIEKAREDIARLFCALLAIHTAGAASKNGTARKLGRMAREALE